MIQGGEYFCWLAGWVEARGVLGLVVVSPESHGWLKGRCKVLNLDFFA